MEGPPKHVPAEELERLRPGLRIMALRALGDADAADEALQETLVRALEALRDGRLSDPARLPAFVAGIARHVISATLRSGRRVVPLSGLPNGDPASPAPDPLEALISDAERAGLRAALTTLSERDREILRLTYFEGLGPTEVASRLGQPPGRVRKRKSRALERLRRALLGSRGGAGHGTVISAT